MQPSLDIHTETIDACSLCHQPGELLYRDLTDVLFGVPQQWSLMQCQGCELTWLHNRPILTDIPKLYQSYHTHDDPDVKFTRGIHRLKWRLRKSILASTNQYSGSRTEKLLGALLARLPGLAENALATTLWIPGPQGKLLDVGCGNGIFLKKMQQLGWSGYGVEFDPNSVKQAIALGFEVKQGALEEAKYEDNSFDLLTMNHVIEHLAHPAATLAECFRVLKPGGHLMMVTPNMNALGHEQFKQAWRGLEIPRHLHLFTQKPLGQMTEASGFTLKQSRSIARTAKNMYLASLSIQHKQQAKPDINNKDHKPAARAFAAEQKRLVETRDCGEELYLLAQKPRL